MIRGAIYRWPFAKDGKAQEVAVTGPLTCDDPLLMIDAALDGVGLTWADEPVVADIAAGRLVRVLADWCPVRPGFFLYYPSRRKGVSAALRALIEALTATEREAVPS